MRGKTGVWFDSSLEGWVVLGFGIRILILRFLLANDTEVPMNIQHPTTKLSKIKSFLVATFCAYGIYQLFNLTIATAATPLFPALR